MPSIQECVNEMKYIHNNSIKLKDNEYAICSRCNIIYARDHVFTQEQFNSPCAWEYQGKSCGGKWIKTLTKPTQNTQWTW
jgi:hypothetical protein